MDAERWKRVDDLLQATLQVPAGRQEEFLRQQCGGDSHLLEEVCSLLTSHRKVGSFLEAPLGVLPPGRSSVTGQTISHYRVLGPLGSGGMGVVYKAEDTLLGRLAALKFLPDETAHEAAALDKKKPASALNALPVPPSIEFGSIQFVNNISCLYHVYVRGEAYLAAGQGTAAAAELQKIIDHNGIVWNCWTGALAHLGAARANALQSTTSQGADADASRARALAAYKDFLTLWKDADPDIPILKQAKVEYAKLQ